MATNQTFYEMLEQHFGKQELTKIREFLQFSRHRFKYNLNSTEKTLKTFTYPHVLWLQNFITELNPAKNTVVTEWFAAQEVLPLVTKR